MTHELPPETIILMGGRCSGQVLDVPGETATITAYDEAGTPSRYVRTELTTDRPDGSRFRVFRREPPAHGRTAAGRHPATSARS